MLRTYSVVISVMMLALTACGSHSAQTMRPEAPKAATSAPAAAAPGAEGETAAPAACPTKATRKFAKTRFVVNAGLAAGAFKRYIYTPYRNNAFKQGAPGRKRAIVKAAAAAVFVLDQLRRAKTNVQADPTLCKALTGPLGKLSMAATALVAKLKKGDADPTQIGSFDSGLEGFRKDAGGAGAGFQDRTPPAGAIGG